MIRLFFTIPLIFISAITFAQDFNGLWINIGATRIDGSRIVPESDRHGSFGYIFAPTGIIFLDSSNFSLHGWQTDMKTADSGKAVTNIMELQIISDSIAIATEKHSPTELDKKNKYVLLRGSYYVKYLKSNGSMPYENDSTILATNYFFPAFSIVGPEGFSDALGGHKIDTVSRTIVDQKNRPVNPWTADPLIAKTFPSGAITGYFILSKNKTIGEVHITGNRNFENASLLIERIKSTASRWNLPIIGYHFKIPFTIVATKTGLDYSFRMNDFERLKEHPYQGPLAEKIQEARVSYNQGMKLAEKGNYEKAIVKLTKSIEADPWYLDAYYNRAFAYFNLNKIEEACVDWAYLKQLEQTTGAGLYKQYCDTK